MTTTTPTANPLASPGETVHFLATTSLSTSLDLGSIGVMVHRGSNVIITAEILRANQDRLGRSIFDLVGDDDAQIEKYGRVLVAPGPWPQGTPTWTHGDPLWAAEREQARSAAWALQDAAERTQALAAVERDFGPAARTSRTTNARGIR